MERPRKTRRASDRVTLSDVARRCGLSTATVSRILNDKLTEFPVADEVVAHVKQTAKELGYRPNRLAQAIRSRRTRLIGLSSVHLPIEHAGLDALACDDQVMGAYIRAICSHPLFKRYDLVIHNREEPEGEPLVSADFQNDLLEGMIYLTPSEHHLEFLDESSERFPIVLLGRVPGAELRLPCVDIDNRKAAKAAVRHLVDTGRRNIMMLVPERLTHIFCIQDRLQGYKDALREAGLPLRGEYVQVVRSLPGTIGSLLHALPFLDEVDALFCPMDEMASFCYPPLLERGRRIPADVAVMGFDDSAIGARLDPPLSTVHRPIERQAFEAADILLGILEKQRPYEPLFREIGTELVVRASTAAPPRS